MQLVVADTGPINYLVLIECIDVLPALFDDILIPASVEAELKDSGAPTPVKIWIDNPPAWLDIRKFEEIQLGPKLPGGLD